MKYMLPGREYVVAFPAPGEYPKEVLQEVKDLFESNGAEVTLVPIYGLSTVEVIDISPEFEPAADLAKMTTPESAARDVMNTLRESR